MRLSEIKSLDIPIPPEFFTDCSEYLEQISNYINNILPQLNERNK